ncbi:MAG: DUF1080 domain-containing protein [Planctomycetes bacterium]|nr:DUF1080 domain-containing protein [Planctomycetota bacterium]
MSKRMIQLLAIALLAGLAPAGEPVKLFNGHDTSGWKTKPHRKNASHWVVGSASIDTKDPRELAVDPKGNELINAPGYGQDLYTEQSFGDCTVELDVMVPRGSNSGIYLMGEYEVQVLDSFDQQDHPGVGDMGAIYGIRPPTHPKYKQPGEWNHFVIEFKAPRFDAAGNKTSNALFLRVTLNGQTIHENVEAPGPTTSALTGKESPAGPLMLQGDHGAVSFRNIIITPR